MTFGKWISAPSYTGTILLGLTGLLSIPSLGCDTVALISFQERNFADIEVSGVMPPVGSCNGSDGAAVMRFVLLADDDQALRPGDDVGQDVVNLTTDDLSLSEGAVFEHPDVLCSDNTSCLSTDYTCSKANDAYDDSLQRCQRSATLAIDGNVTFASDTQKNQLFGLVVENSGSLAGWLPRDVGALYPDWDGDGTADDGPDVNLNPARATDRRNTRQVAFKGNRAAWDLVRTRANAESGRKTLFGLWYFGGTSTAAGVTSPIAETTGGSTMWAGQPETVDSALRLIPDPDALRGNVYQAAVTALEDGFADPEYADYEKTMVIFADGPDELRLDNFSMDDVIDLAKQNNVRVFVVQLDAAVQVDSGDGASQLLRDDPDYWRNQAVSCGSDADCLNYEECRVPLGYSSSPGGTVEIGTPDTYCLVRRDDNGRVGPIEDYARLACETEGGYMLVNFSRTSGSSGQSQAINRRMGWLPHVMDGLWEAETSLDVIENGQVPTASSMKIQSTFSVNVAQIQQTYLMSQLGDPGAGRQDDDQDTRLVLFSE